MSKSLSLAVALAFALSAFGSSALADKQCRDAKGKFVKCGAPGAKPVK